MGFVCSTLIYKIIVNPAIITSSILSNNGFNVSAVGVSDGAINITVTGGSGSIPICGLDQVFHKPGIFLMLPREPIR
jgi:hypothetical protein